MRTKPNSQIIGNSGVFYACYRLSLENWHVLPTTRNARGADIFIVKGERMLGLEVKTLSARDNICIGHTPLDYSIDYWVILMNIWYKKEEEKPDLYIISKGAMKIEIERCNLDNRGKGLLKLYPDGYWIQKKFLLSEVHEYSKDWSGLE